MKKSIHPNSQKVIVSCNACNYEAEVLTTKKDPIIEICANCHVFYTKGSYGDRKVGRVSRFNQKYAKVKPK